jgi:hypothetical protein
MVAIILHLFPRHRSTFLWINKREAAVAPLLPYVVGLAVTRVAITSMIALGITIVAITVAIVAASQQRRLVIVVVD